MMESLDSWYIRLTALAESKGIEFLLSGDPEDYREGWQDGETIEDELEHAIDSARYSY